MISLRSVTYHYPNRKLPALDGVNLDIRSGEFALIAGDSGSGKSTLLRTMNGLVPHFSGGRIGGTVIVAGHDAVEAGPQLLSRYAGFVAQVPEDQSLMEIVEAEVAFALENAAVPRSQMVERVDEALELVGLKQLRQRRIATLSGGERQRVAIASALALKPTILILDEPTSQLDPETAETILKTLRMLQKDHGLTVVLAEHRLERVLPLADSIAYMENGRVLAHGTAREVIAHLPVLPPVTSLARRLDWRPLPLSVEEARAFLAERMSDDREDRLIAPPESMNQRACADTLLQTVGLHFSYDKDQWAIEDINLCLDRGEILAIVGSNGSGKSTLLKAIVALIKPDRGDILRNGRSIAGQKTVELAKTIAYLPQNPDDLLFAETVRHEFEITLQNHNLSTDRRVEETLAELALAEFAEHYPRDLSTGQRQRVALGAITITWPEIVLLDEPTRGLDGQMKDQLIAIWRGWKAAGVGIIVVTHDVELAAQVADHVIILDRGKVVESGSARAVLGRQSAVTPQIARLFPGRGWLTTQDALNGLQNPAKSLL